MSEKELSIKLLLNDKEALSKLQKALRQIEGEGRSSADSLNLGWTALASKFYLAEQAIRPVISFMGQAVRAATEEEEAIRRLNFALQQQGTFSGQLSTKLQALAESFEATTRFSDDSVLGLMQTLVTIGNVGPENLQRVSQAALDLATATGRDLATAGELLAKAASGNVAALGRLGIKIDENTLKGMKFEEILRLIEQRMGGAAQDAVDSFAGQQARLALAWGRVMEQLGKFVTESPKAQAYLEAMADAASELAEHLKTIRGEHPDLLGDVFEGLSSVSPLAQGARLAGALSGGANSATTIAAAMFGTPPQNQQVMEENTGIILDAAAQAAVTAYEQMEAQRQQQLTSDITALNAFVAGEDLKLQTILSNTAMGEQIRNEATMRELERVEKLVRARAVLGDAELKQLAAIEQAKQKIAMASAKGKFETEKTFALATADLMDAVAVASGKGIIKGIAIVLKAVVTAVETMQTVANPWLAFLKITTTVIQTANALQQLSAAEKALEASRGESIQAVTAVPGFARGVTDFVRDRVTGGLAVVGERGTELVNLPNGADVIPNNRIRDFLGSSGARLSGSEGGSVYHISVSIHNPVFAPGNLSQQIAEQIGPEISKFLDRERERL